MFRPVALYIGLRYTRAKRRNHFISFISLTSMLGIALGVTVLITVLSVMNGFDEVIRNRILSMARHITVSHVIGGEIRNWQPLQAKLKQSPGVLGAAPFINGQGMLTHLGQVHPAVIMGVEPQTERQVSELDKKMVAGSLNALKPQRFGMVIGQSLANGLGLGLQDKVTVVIPQASLTPAGMVPRFKRFTVVGIFKVGNGVGFDDQVAFINLQDAQALYQLKNTVTGIRLKIQDLYKAPQISQDLAKQLPISYQVSNWVQDYGAFFSVIRLEKTMMFLILTLIIAVAAFNLVSTLVMTVTDKKADIAILRTLGATPRTILAIFMVQGTVIGLFGTLLGLIGGVLLSYNATSLVSFIEQAFHTKLLSADYYYVNYLPSKLEWSDVSEVCLMSLIMSLIATIYPAWRAAKVQPAEALRYE